VLVKRLNARYLYAGDIDKNVTQMFEAQTRTYGSRRMTGIWPKLAAASSLFEDEPHY
jgi:hypothetical protein